MNDHGLASLAWRYGHGATRRSVTSPACNRLLKQLVCLGIGKGEPITGRRHEHKGQSVKQLIGRQNASPARHHRGRQADRRKRRSRSARSFQPQARTNQAGARQMWPHAVELVQFVSGWPIIGQPTLHRKQQNFACRQGYERTDFATDSQWRRPVEPRPIVLERLLGEVVRVVDESRGWGQRQQELGDTAALEPAFRRDALQYRPDQVRRESIGSSRSSNKPIPPPAEFDSSLNLSKTSGHKSGTNAAS
ncbi:MAG: hypothetical protein E5Y29_11630 [Mesorhizobium sp.]|nr:MAG: hypothetical protein E5Y29_11630 [Mesorhizobium sp.]